MKPRSRRFKVTWVRRCGLPLCGLCCVAACAWVGLRWARRARRPADAAADARRTGRLALPCLVLTSNASALHPSVAGCTQFLGPRFTEKEFANVSAEAREMLARPQLLRSASDLTNNASVNIYMNHARMWAQVAERWDTALVLEDDAVLPPNADEVLAEVLARLRQANASNFVVKLHDSSSTYLQWQHVCSVTGYDVRRCACRPRQECTSALAYVIDRAAARTLLRHAYPARMQLDVFQYEMGCIEHKIDLYALTPFLAHPSGRPSTHLSDSPQRMYLRLKRSIQNILDAEC